MPQQPVRKIEMRDLYRELAPMFGLEQRQVEYYARFLRQEDLLGAGRPGHGGHTPHATPRAVAVFLLAVLGSTSAVDGPKAVKKLEGLRRDAVKEVGKHAKTEIAPKSRFLEALTHVLEKMSASAADNPWRKQVMRVGARSGPSGGLVGLIEIGRGKDKREHAYRSSQDDQKQYGGLTKETWIGTAVLTKVADLLATGSD